MTRRGTSIPQLRRYTSIASLLAILSRRELTLLSPLTWDDKNDRNFMQAYTRANRLKTCLALCFSRAAETYHHWKTFTPGDSGARIDFSKAALLSALPRRGFSYGSIGYMTVPKLLSREIKPKQLAFVKRSAFRDEKEYRIVFGSRTETLLTKSVALDLGIISGVVINPWLPKALFEALRDVIKGIDGCENIFVYQSALTDHDVWRQYAEGYA